MTGTVAQTIQGEAGNDPNAQFAVAATIYNRLQAGTYGGSASAIVNAPNQFTGYSAHPNASAQVFAQAIEDGSLPNYGSTGNAVNFASGGVGNRVIGNTGSNNIGGNLFSDNWGPPSSGFTAPQYNGTAGGQASDPALGPGEGDYWGNQQGQTGGTPDVLGSPATSWIYNPDTGMYFNPDTGQVAPPGTPGLAGNAQGSQQGGQAEGFTPSPAPGSASGLGQIGAFLADMAVRAALVVLGIVLIAAAAKALTSGETGAQETIANLRPSEVFPTIRRI